MHLLHENSRFVKSAYQAQYGIDRKTFAVKDLEPQDVGLLTCSTDEPRQNMPDRMELPMWEECLRRLASQPAPFVMGIANE